jgi:hypothetical protein
MDIRAAEVGATKIVSVEYRAAEIRLYAGINSPPKIPLARC